MQCEVPVEPPLSPNCHSCQFADKRAERGYYDESDVVLCVN